MIKDYDIYWCLVITWLTNYMLQQRRKFNHMCIYMYNLGIPFSETIAIVFVSRPSLLFAHKTKTTPSLVSEEPQDLLGYTFQSSFWISSSIFEWRPLLPENPVWLHRMIYLPLLSSIKIICSFYKLCLSYRFEYYPPSSTVGKQVAILSGIRFATSSADVCE